MFKKDIITKLAKQTELDEGSSKIVLNIVLAEIARGLKKHKRVTLTGFGTFEVRRRKKRSMRNIHTGDMIVIPAHKMVGFVAGETLKKGFR